MSTQQPYFVDHRRGEVNELRVCMLIYRVHGLVEWYSRHQLSSVAFRPPVAML